MRLPIAQRGLAISALMAYYVYLGTGGKVDVTKEQMVFAEATSVLPLIASDAYHKGEWKNRIRKNFSKIF